MSLVELVVTIVVLAIALSGTLLVVDTTTRNSADPLLERQAIAIAEAYLEEILQKSYLDPDDGSLCPLPEPNRALYDNVCDYNGLDETGARDQRGQPVNGLEAYRIEVGVDLSATLGGLNGPADVLRVDVSVSDPLGRPVLLAAYRTSS